MKINLEQGQQATPAPQDPGATPDPAATKNQPPIPDQRPKYTYTQFWFIKKRVIQDRILGGKKHVRYYVEWSKK
jgi:hypothetical protein